MPHQREFRKPLEELEREARVPIQDQVEVVDAPEAPLPDPRGENPDRDWFLSGG